MKDAIGNELKVGDAVAWGAGGRLTHGLRTGEVSELKQPRHDRDPCVRVTILKGAFGKGGWMRPDQVVRVIVP